MGSRGAIRVTWPLNILWQGDGMVPAECGRKANVEPRGSGGRDPVELSAGTQSIGQPVADERLADARVVGLAMRGASLCGIEDAEFNRHACVLRKVEGVERGLKTQEVMRALHDQIWVLEPVQS